MFKCLPFAYSVVYYRFSFIKRTCVCFVRRAIILFINCLHSSTRKATRKDSMYEYNTSLSRVSIFRALLSEFPSSGEVLGEIFDYGQYIIQPETLCRTDWYTDAILALTAYIHGHSEQMPLSPNIACGTLPSITLVPIENSPVYIPSYIPYEDTYCTRHSIPIQGGSFRSAPSAESIGIHVSK